MEFVQRETESRALLAELTKTQRQSLLYARITMITTLVLTIALLVSAAVLVPKIMRTLNMAQSAVTDIRETTARFNSSLDGLNNLTRQFEALVGSENAEKLGGLLDALSALDLEGLTESIQKFNAVIESLANFRLFG